MIYDYLQKINTLKQNINVTNVGLFFKRGNGAKPLGTSNVFYVKLKSTNDLNKLQDVAKQKNVSIVKNLPNMPFWYILKLNRNTIGDSLDLCNQFF